jgi:hypothetical protein
MKIHVHLHVHLQRWHFAAPPPPHPSPLTLACARRNFSTSLNTMPEWAAMPSSSNTSSPRFLATKVACDRNGEHFTQTNSWSHCATRDGGASPGSSKHHALGTGFSTGQANDSTAVGTMPEGMGFDRGRSPLPNTHAPYHFEGEFLSALSQNFFDFHASGRVLFCLRLWPCATNNTETETSIKQVHIPLPPPEDSRNPPR